MGDIKVTKDFENKTLILERTFAAPANTLWDIFTTKDKFVQWWGPQGWETTVTEFEFAPSGRAHYRMKCVDEAQGEFFGQEAWGLMVYDAIDTEALRYSYVDYFSNAEGTIDETMPATSTTLELIEADGMTTVRNTITVQKTEDLEQLVNMGMVEGYNSSLDRLEQLL